MAIQTQKVEEIDSQFTEKFDEIESNIDLKVNEIKRSLTAKIEESKITEKVEIIESQLTEKVDEIEREFTEKVNNIESQFTEKVEKRKLDQIIKKLESKFSQKVEEIELSHNLIATSQKKIIDNASSQKSHFSQLQTDLSQLAHSIAQVKGCLDLIESDGNLFKPSELPEKDRKMIKSVSQRTDHVTSSQEEIRASLS